MLNSETKATSDVEAILWRHNTSKAAEKNLWSTSRFHCWNFGIKAPATRWLKYPVKIPKARSFSLLKKIFKAKECHKVFVRKRLKPGCNGFYSVWLSIKINCLSPQHLFCANFMMKVYGRFVCHSDVTMRRVWRFPIYWSV